MSEVTKPLCLDETLQDVAAAIRGVSVGNYVVTLANNNRLGTVVGGGLYPTGVTVTLNAAPNEGCYFLAWKDANGNILSIETTYSFVSTKNEVITAYFVDTEYVKIVPFATGDDADLITMVNAHYNGLIDLHDYWSVGDTRLITLSAMNNTDGTITVGESHIAQDAEFVLMDSTLDGFVLESDGMTKPAFVSGMKNSLINSGFINAAGTSAGGWSQCTRRDWCNGIFANAVPSAFRGLFKQFKWSLNSGSDLTETTDLFALAPQKCVLGSGGYHGEADLYNQWEWYQTADNIKKKRGQTGDVGTFWTSTKSDNNVSMVAILPSGTVLSDYASKTFGLSVFGCI